MAPLPVCTDAVCSRKVCALSHTPGQCANPASLCWHTRCNRVGCRFKHLVGQRVTDTPVEPVRILPRVEVLRTNISVLQDSIDSLKRRMAQLNAAPQPQVDESADEFPTLVQKLVSAFKGCVRDSKDTELDAKK